MNEPDASITCSDCYVAVQQLEVPLNVVYEAHLNGFAEVTTGVSIGFDTCLGVSVAVSNGTGAHPLTDFRSLVENHILARYNVFALAVSLQPVVTANLSQESSVSWATTRPTTVDTGAASASACHAPKLDGSHPLLSAMQWHHADVWLFKGDF